MQEWVFDRDGAQTRGKPTATPGPPPPSSPRRRLSRRGRLAVAAGAAVAVLTGGFAVAAASPDETQVAAVADQTAPQAQTPQRVPSTEVRPDDGTRDEDTPTTTDAAPWSSLHEEREMQQPDGTTLTIALQGGTVTTLTADSVTVESSDGFSRTYGVTSDTRIATADGTLADLQTGDAVLVEAVVEGDTATAATIRPAPTAGGQDSSDDSTSGDGQDA